VNVYRIFGRGEAGLAESVFLNGRLGGGYGWEDGEGRPVGNAALGLRWLISQRMEISGEFSYFRNPNYWASEASLQLTFRF